MTFSEQRLHQRPVLFLDRDGTIIADAHYLADANRVRLLEGAALAIRSANEAGVPVVIITNQSGIARGLITEEQYAAVRDRTVELLRAEGANILATYHCPHPASRPAICDCRKPGLGLYLRAAREHDLDLSLSGYVGDRWRDVQPAIDTGGTGVLVPGSETPVADMETARSSISERVFIADSIAEAVNIVLRNIAGATGAGGTVPGTTPQLASQASPAGSSHRPGRTRIAVLASGGGSNLQALIDHFNNRGAASGSLVHVASDKKTAGALVRAEGAGIPTGTIDDPTNGVRMVAQLRECGADLIVLAGYMRLIPPEVVQTWRGRLINIHPALLPAFGGKGMYGQRIHAAVIEQGVRVTGVTVHFVDEHYDRGPILAQWPVPVLSGDTAESLAARVLATEHLLLPLCVEAVAAGTLRLGENGHVHGGMILPARNSGSNDLRFSLAAQHGSGTASEAAFATELATMYSP